MDITDTVVVRDIEVFATGDPANGDIFALDFDGFVFWAFGCPAGGLYQVREELRAVAPGPTVLTAQWQLGSAASAVVYVSGYVLTP